MIGDKNGKYRHGFLLEGRKACNVEECWLEKNRLEEGPISGPVRKGLVK